MTPVSQPTQPAETVKADKLHGYEADDKSRIVNIASRLVAGQIERGEIPMTDEAIKAAMPAAVRDAKQLVNAMWEYLS